VFKVVNDAVEIEKCANRNETYSDFLNFITPKGPRWIILDLDYAINENGSKINKNEMILIIFLPEPCSSLKERATLIFKKDQFIKWITPPAEPGAAVPTTCVQHPVHKVIPNLKIRDITQL
jgi:hypothetical protein